jgi:MFS family permease
VLFCFTSGNELLYWAFAILFGIGYGVSYPILIAVTAKDAHPDFVAQTLQLFAFTYFGGIFGFPLIAGWMIVDLGSYSVLALVAAMAGIEASLAQHRAITA